MGAKLEYFRYDFSPLWGIHIGYFQNRGLAAWRRGEVPYTGISNYYEALKKAKLLIANLKQLNKTGSPIKVLEVGAGSGEFAKNFLLAFQSECEREGLSYFDNLHYCLSDFSQKTIDELSIATKFDQFKDKLEFRVYDALSGNFDLGDSYESSPGGFDAIVANYLLDQLPVRVIARSKGIYLEKYTAIETDTDKSIKKLIKHHKFEPLVLDIPLKHFRILETCFRTGTDSTVLYSYGALKALGNFLQLLSAEGLIICSDFNASSRPGIDTYEPCYYGNSLAQAVNFEFLAKCHTELEGAHCVLLFEDPIKPLHTFILTKVEFPHKLKLGELYEEVFKKNWLLRIFYRYLAELRSCFLILLLIMGLYLVMHLTSHF